MCTLLKSALVVWSNTRPAAFVQKIMALPEQIVKFNLQQQTMIWGLNYIRKRGLTAHLEPTASLQRIIIVKLIGRSPSFFLETRSIDVTKPRVLHSGRDGEEERLQRDPLSKAQPRRTWWLLQWSWREAYQQWLDFVVSAVSRSIPGSVNGGWRDLQMRSSCHRHQVFRWKRCRPNYRLETATRKELNAAREIEVLLEDVSAYTSPRKITLPTSNRSISDGAISSEIPGPVMTNPRLRPISTRLTASPVGTEKT